MAVTALKQVRTQDLSRHNARYTSRGMVRRGHRGAVGRRPPMRRHRRMHQCWWSRSENRSKSEPASQPVSTGSGAIGASVALIARIRACWTRVDLRLTGVTRWSGRGLRGGIDLSTGRSIGSRRHVGSVSRNRGCLWRREAVSRIRYCSGRIWRATIKTAVIITWGGATVHAKRCHGSCGSEHEHTHDGLLLPWRPQIILVCSRRAFLLRCHT